MPRSPDHFTHLKRLLSLEQKAERAQLEELRGTLTLGERQARGLTLLGLELREESVGLGGRILQTFERTDRQPLAFIPEGGDLVELTARRPDPPPSAKGVVSRANATRVQVAFDQPPPPFVSEGALVLDLAPNDVTFARARTALDQTLALDKGAARHRRDVLLGEAPAKFDRPAPFEASRPLNPEQQEAVSLALAAEDFFLVHGPPGTGKSTVLAEIAVQAVARGERLLLTAASNAAVDHLLALALGAGLSAIRVGHPARVAPHLQEHTLDLIVEEEPDRKIARELFDEAFELFGYARKQRTRGRSRERFANARESAIEARRLIDEAKRLERKAVRAVLDRARVVCATCTSLPSGPLASEAFDRVLFDEATQATEPVALIAYLKAPRVVLAGDHQQLSAVVKSPDAAKQGLAKSLFERLLEDQGEGVKRMLREQYRMHAQIMAFPSREMYGGELRAHPSVAARTLSEVLTPGAQVDAPPVLFLDTAGKGFEDEVDAENSSRFNRGEADLVVGHAKALLAAGLAPSELAVIAPYRAQVNVIRALLGRDDVEVDTVDAFQGREKDAVLVSMTRANTEGELGFLKDLRRMNVALTRARRHLFVVGDSATLGAHAYYGRFIEAAQSDGGYRSAWEWTEA